MKSAWLSHSLGQSSLFPEEKRSGLKLTAQLQQNSGGNMYLWMSPRRLHFDDIRNLLILLDKIISNGNTVMIVEHNPDMIRSADWVTDLAGGAGDRGRLVVHRERFRI